MAGQLVGELHVHDRTDDLNDFAFIHVVNLFSHCVNRCRVWPPAISSKFLRDIPLAQFVVFERQVLDQFGGVVCGVLHRHHAGALFAGFGFQQDPVDKNLR